MATDKSKEAMKLALEKIANVNAMDYEYQAWAREALAEQPAQQQEPVAIPDCGEAGHADGACGNGECLPSFRRNATPPAQQEPEIVQRVKRYAGQTMRTARNPNITARECIELANWLVANTTPQPAQQEPEFFTHCVDQPYDWSEWVCPDPKGYLMKCCDCGLVHEAEFGVVRYKSETEREDCDMVDDPNLQAVFRMRRSEQWSPADTAHRAGGLTMEQPAQQEPVAWIYSRGKAKVVSVNYVPGVRATPLYTSPPAQRKPLVGLTVCERTECFNSAEWNDLTQYAEVIEAKLKEKNQ